VIREAQRPLHVAEMLAVGSELTVGETRDTNSAEIAAALTAAGVLVGRIQDLPDDLATVRGAFADALTRADLVVSTGGLGPTPDDLTREAIAALCGEQPVVDGELEAWLRGLWARRGIEFPELNLKQAWLIPSATAIPNGNGTAPGWWVERPDGRLIVALPGPPREMRPMWADWALPRLRQRGLGRPAAIRTLRLTGIGESQVADILGDALLRGTNPQVATYARVDAVDVRISAVGEPGGDRSAVEVVVAATERRVREALGKHIWGTGSTTWADAIGERLAAHGWRLAAVEIGTGGSVTALVGDAAWLTRIESRRVDGGAADDLEATAAGAAAAAGVEVGVAVRATERGDDTAVSVAVVTPLGSHRERRIAFLGGAQGRARAALTAAGIVFAALAPGDAAAPGRADGRPPAASGARS
jgi:nicotinamide-nucleotide amidase